jgi:hypothetical protein
MSKSAHNRSLLWLLAICFALAISSGYGAPAWSTPAATGRVEFRMAEPYGDRFGSSRVTFYISAVDKNGKEQRLCRIGADPKWHPMNYHESEEVSLPAGVHRLRLEMKWLNTLGPAPSAPDVVAVYVNRGEVKAERDIEVREGATVPVFIVVTSEGVPSLDPDYQPPAPPPTQSPMTFEIPFEASNPDLWGRGEIALRESLEEHVCDGVSISRLAVAPQKPVNAAVAVKVVFTLYNKPGHDKVVDVAFALVREDELLAKEVSLQGIEVEETRSVARSFTFSIPEERLRAEPAPVMRITLSVIDD